MSDRTCSGKCCAVFTYSTPLEKLRENPEKYRDGKFLADMLIELTPEEAMARAERFDIPMAPPTKPVYTCRHWDEETRLCGVYEERPRMCRDYPYARACDHDECCQYRPPYKTQIRYMPRTKVWEGDYA